MKPSDGVCPVCEREAPQDLVRTWSTGARLLRCSACGAGHAEPFKAAGEEWYARCGIYEGGRDEKYPLEWRHERFFEVMERPVPGTRVLDVGCGMGAFLKAAREHGYDVRGLDFEPARAAFGRRAFGVPIEVATLAEHLAAGNGGRYGVVTCFEILEHVEDPVRFISQVRESLAPDGLVAVSMPNWQRTFQLSSQIGDYPPHHLTWWTPDTIRSFLERNGFTDTRVYEEAFDLRRVLFLTLHTGVGRLAAATVGKIARTDPARAQVVMRRLTRVTKQALLSVAVPVGAALRAVMPLTGIGLLAIARRARA